MTTGDMLTISQLAAYAGVTVRAVRHYHAKGLLPEPERDHSGYRRYDAAAVVELIRIRTLADAGVPLSRVQRAAGADEEEFAAAVDDIDRRLRAEIRERQRHRERIAQLAAGDSLALPPEAVAYLDRLRELGVPERVIDGGARRLDPRRRADPGADAGADGAQAQPDRGPCRRRDLLATSCAGSTGQPDDPRLPAVADRLVGLFEADSRRATEGRTSTTTWPPHELVALLD